MKNRIGKITAAFALLYAFNAGAQQNVQPCDTYKAMEEVFAQDPAAKQNYDNIQAIIQQQLEEYKKNHATDVSNGKTSSFQYTIPVVFHILHTNGAENISDALCIAAVAQMNSDYNKLGSDAGQVTPPWNTRYISSDIVFMLAHKDPNGNCTNGIVHRYDERTVWDRNGSMADLNKLYAGIIWNPTKYLNIIIVKDIVASSGQNGIVVGYTYKPGTWPSGDAKDCIVYNYGYLSGLQARSLSHEAGHWFGLDHTFGNTNNPGVSCGDDNIYDTPPTKGAFSTCPPSTSGNACATTGNTVYAAGSCNYENFMDYSSCPRNFTSDQTTVMRSTLANATNGRNNLWSTTNLAATDVNGTGNCAPIASYYSTNNSYTVCAGGSITFKDNSYNATVSNYAWASDNNATTTSSNASSATFNFPLVGTCNVTLTASNSVGSSQMVKQVTVMDPSPGVVGPMMESFETGTVPDGWSVKQSTATTGGWQPSFAAALDGGASFFIDGSVTGASQSYVLETPIIDIASNPGAKFEFAVAYAQYASGTAYLDQLKIQASTDCGGTWIDVRSISATVLRTNSGGVSAVSYTPSVPEEWNKFDLTGFPYWGALQNSTNAIIRFNFITGTNGHGNNIFLDAVNLYGATGVQTQFRSRLHYSVQPNPSAGDATVFFTLNESSNISLEVKDVLGRTVSVVAREQKMDQGDHTFSLANTNLPEGVYFVNLTVNGTVVTTKMVVNH